MRSVRTLTIARLLCTSLGACALAAITWIPNAPAAAQPPAAGSSAQPGEVQPGASSSTPTALADRHHETPDDPQAAAGPLRTAPPAPLELRARDGFVSVQVNVDADGNDILGDAANEPSIAVDPLNPNRIVIGWRQFDTITSNFRQAGNAFSREAGRHWTFPGVLTPGVFRSDPVMEAGPQGWFHYYSLKGGDFACDMFISVDGGATWSPPFPAYGGDKEWFTINKTDGPGRGLVHAVWSPFASPTPGYFETRSTDGGRMYEFPRTIGNFPQWGTVAVGPEGEVYVYSAFSSFARSTNAWNAGESPVFDFLTSVPMGSVSGFGGVNPDGILGQGWVDVDRSQSPSRGNVYVAQTLVPSFDMDPGGIDPHDFHLRRSEDSGQTWSPTVRINDDPRDTGAWQWFGTISVAPNGRIDAVWYDTRNDVDLQNPTTYVPRYSEVYYSYSVDGGRTWAPNVPISQPFNHFLGYPQQNKLGDYIDMESDNVGANLAYAATFTGGQDVYFLRIGDYDCNGNGVGDAADIAGGGSADANSDGIPDECQCLADLDGDGEVRLADLSILLTNFETTAGARPEDGDLDADGDVDGEDLLHFLAAFGKFCHWKTPPTDCNGNGIDDAVDFIEGVTGDCNRNGVLDSCDIADGASTDCDGSGIPDDCSPDCNGNGVPDKCDLASGESSDVNHNRIPDECESCAEVRSTRLTAADAGNGDEFGFAVSLSGDLLAAGADRANPYGNDSGAVHVLRHDGDRWVEEAMLLAGDGAAEDRFGSAVGASGDRVVVGARFHDALGSNAGAAYVFRYSGGAWELEAKLLASDGAQNDRFGHAVAIDGGRVVVGARNDRVNTVATGSAYVFAFDGQTWTEETKLLATDGAAGDLFGTSVAIDGDTILVGASGDVDGGIQSGSAYVFVRDAGVWSQQAKLLASDRAEDDAFGVSVALRDGMALIGADRVNYDTFIDDAGAAYAFRASGSLWSQESRLDPSLFVTDGRFGAAVAIAPERLVVGQPGDVSLVTFARTGSASLFTRDGPGWALEQRLMPAALFEGDDFGSAVAADGARAVIGAHLQDGRFIDSGSIWVYDGSIPCEPP